MRRKGIPCGPDCCSPSKHCVKAINNVSPDPNGDLTLKAGNGIAISQTGDDEITITNDAIASSFVAGDNIEINPVGNNLEIRVTDDVSINNLNVAGDIIQQGAAYETHAEKIFTTNDYIYMRDGAVGGLTAGSFAGFQVEKYDGTNDGRLVIDNSGVARVGDVGDEQPLLTREESANLNNGALLKWDGVNLKAIDEGTVGSDTKPIKIVNGVAVAVTDDLAKASELPTVTTPSLTSANASITITQKAIRKYGKIVCITSEIRSDAVVTAGTILLRTDALPIVRSWGAFISLSSNSNNLSLDLRTNGDIASTGNTASGMYYEINLAYICL